MYYGTVRPLAEGALYCTPSRRRREFRSYMMTPASPSTEYLQSALPVDNALCIMDSESDTVFPEIHSVNM